MKAVIIKEFGGRDKLTLADIPKPEPGEGEVLVRIRAAGVNPVDFKIREGVLQKRGYPHCLPLILGWDMAGVVETVGHSARRFKPGDEVYGYCRRPVIEKGCYAEYIAIPESYITLKPRRASFEEAAAIPLAALTAYQSVFQAGGLKKGQNIVVAGASGGVGSFAVQYGRITGAKVVGVASKKNHSYIKKLGATAAIDYHEGDFRDGVKRVFKKGADVIFACVGGESLLKCYDLVRRGGTLVTIVEPGDEALAKSRGVRVHYVFVEPNVTQLDQIREWIDDRKLRVKVSAVYPLSEAAKAHEQIETFHTQGKIALRVA